MKMNSVETSDKADYKSSVDENMIIIPNFV
jgi:hypothetical protein